MEPITQFIDDTLGLGHPLFYLMLFLGASWLLVWRLEAMMEKGLEGTAAGALILPLCSGLGNLFFVFVASRNDIAATEVATNAVGNNLTNLLIILPVTALFLPLTLRAATAKRKRKTSSKNAAKDPEVRARLNSLSIQLTLGAALLFATITWALGLDGQLERGDGLALIALYLLWQGFHLYDVRKQQLVSRQNLSPLIVFDAAVALGSAALLLASLDWLVSWISNLPGGSLAADHIGWITAWLMVLPNAALAVYYAVRSRGDVVFASQVGDGHICIPLCLGIAAALNPFAPPAWMASALLVLGGAAVYHALCVALFSGLPRILAIPPILAYAWCLKQGLG